MGGQFSQGEGIITETLPLSETWEKSARGNKNKQKEKVDKYVHTLKKKMHIEAKKKKIEKRYNNEEQ